MTKAALPLTLLQTGPGERELLLLGAQSSRHVADDAAEPTMDTIPTAFNIP